MSEVKPAAVFLATCGARIREGVGELARGIKALISFRIAITVLRPDEAKSLCKGFAKAF
jgi:hypothetical protein